jgi:hypothetical protein
LRQVSIDARVLKYAEYKYDISFLNIEVSLNHIDTIIENSVIGGKYKYVEETLNLDSSGLEKVTKVSDCKLVCIYNAYGGDVGVKMFGEDEIRRVNASNLFEADTVFDVSR